MNLYICKLLGAFVITGVNVREMLFPGLYFVSRIWSLKIDPRKDGAFPNEWEMAGNIQTKPICKGNIKQKSKHFS